MTLDHHIFLVIMEIQKWLEIRFRCLRCCGNDCPKSFQAD
ncbi:unnamed protein product [Brugia timori]|uniref:Uncharacterized protein n=1 Tax=Brugia timori TaxID=42155 RepID=A0A0R3Q540_9BILA|nr:unnamed protein product [Brugia timori]